MKSFAVFLICAFSLHICSADLETNSQPTDVQLRENPYQNSSYFKIYQKKSNARHCHSMCETGCQGKEIRGCMILDHGPYKCYETGRCVPRENDRPMCQCQHEVPCTVRAHFEFKPDRNETVSLEGEEETNEENDVDPMMAVTPKN